MYSTVVVGSDGSRTALEAVRHAAAVANAFGAALHVVTAVKPDTQQLEMARVGAGHAQVIARELGVDPVTHIEQGEASDVLCTVAGRLGADLVVVGNKGMGGMGRVLGSVPNRVAHNAPCSVLIVETT